MTLGVLCFLCSKGASRVSVSQNGAAKRTDLTELISLRDGAFESSWPKWSADVDRSWDEEMDSEQVHHVHYVHSYARGKNKKKHPENAFGGSKNEEDDAFGNGNVGTFGQGDMGGNNHGDMGGDGHDTFGQGAMGGNDHDTFGQGAMGGDDHDTFGQGAMGGDDHDTFGQGAMGGDDHDTFGQGAMGGDDHDTFGQGAMEGNDRDTFGHGDMGSDDHDTFGHGDMGGNDHDTFGQVAMGGDDHDTFGQGAMGGNDRDTFGQGAMGGDDHDTFGQGAMGGNDRDTFGQGAMGGNDRDTFGHGDMGGDDHDTVGHGDMGGNEDWFTPPAHLQDWWYNAGAQEPQPYYDHGDYGDMWAEGSQGDGWNFPFGERGWDAQDRWDAPETTTTTTLHFYPPVPAIETYVNQYNASNPLKIKTHDDRGKNYFLIIGDWGKAGGPGSCQLAVATRLRQYVTEQRALGKQLLFIASVGDNFYWTGATPEA